MKLIALTTCHQTHDKAPLYGKIHQVTIRRGWESWMRPHSWKQCHMPCSPVVNNLMLPCTFYRRGGGLVATSYLTLATPQTVAFQAPLSTGFSRQEYWRILVAVSFSKGSSQARDQTRDSCIAGRLSTY